MIKLFPYLALKNAKNQLLTMNFFGTMLLDHSPIAKEMADQFNFIDEQLENSTLHDAFSL